MENSDKTLRYLQDLYERAERTGTYQYSGFLSPAEQESFRRLIPFGAYSFDGGTEAAERRILICGREEDFGYAPEPPISVLEIRCASEKFGEELTHRDYLGAILNLGIDRSLTGDILIRGKTAWLICLQSIADFLTDSLTRVRHTPVRVTVPEGPVEALEPVLEPVSLNVSSERLDALLAAFCGLSRTKAAELISAERVRIDGILITSPDRRLKEGETLSVRGFGKAIYDGIRHETKKGRYFVEMRRYK